MRMGEENIISIPVLCIPFSRKSDKIAIYFHGNAEDIGLAFDMLFQFGVEMKMHVLAMEYPGYGLYKTAPTDEKVIG